ncbi:hypothetical protein [uncultured Dubosiella sp.]|jgi:hypothetical protein|uniref:hypothetical protein n=1 Tax=uncultured Dubosiella sp. TaxID=1937011 RepID=UPI002080ECA7|nr:hypothetical protein [uncultured Dubosiella sp.]GJM56479.1 hypothetical protein EROP_01720 [Erysipelotrichaceae bacterium OPF54]
MRKIVKIEPYYEPRMWGGGSRLKEEFHYATDVAPLGEVYNVVALPFCSGNELHAFAALWFVSGMVRMRDEGAADPGEYPGSDGESFDPDPSG